jgi:hypothetical protein
MMSAKPILPPPNGPSARQRSVRRRASGRPLQNAVRLAADTFFQFTHRAKRSKALWSDTDHVWLGSKTFLDWAMSEKEINIPWVVAKASDAPHAADELREAVHGELVAYWADRMASLPSKSNPRWLPLP